MNQNCAPVIIPTLNRLIHLQRCIESLRLCMYADKTDLFIALDYPPSEKYVDEWKEVNNYLSKISTDGFKSVTVVKREVNFGAHDNVIQLLNEVLKTYDRFILSEDDNEFSSDFLNYMNQGLTTYEDRSDIFSICGYMYPINSKINLPDFFLYDGFSAWGWGGWKKKYLELTWDLKEVKESLESKEGRKMITSKHVLSHLKNGIKINKLGGDTYICYYQMIHGVASIFPNISRVRNHGYDGSGVHCNANEKEQIKLTRQPIYENTVSYLFPKNISVNLEIKKEIDSHLTRDIWYIRLLKNPHLIFPKIISKFKKLFQL